MVSPPSTASVCPVMYDALSLARNSAVRATSSAAPNRPSGMRDLYVVWTASGKTDVISVSIKPGAIALTRRPREPNPSATDFVRPSTPGLRRDIALLPRMAPQCAPLRYVDDGPVFLRQHDLSRR